MLIHLGSDQAGDEMLDSRMACVPFSRAGYGLLIPANVGKGIIPSRQVVAL
jgi:hypothetical protein